MYVEAIAYPLEVFIDKVVGGASCAPVFHSNVETLMLAFVVRRESEPELS